MRELGQKEYNDVLTCSHEGSWLFTKMPASLSTEACGMVAVPAGMRVSSPCLPRVQEWPWRGRLLLEGEKCCALLLRGAF